MKRSRLSRGSMLMQKSRLKSLPKFVPFSKVVRIGTVKVDGRYGSIYAKASYNEKGNLSISGVIAPLPSGNALGSAGQIDMGFAHRNRADDDARYSYDELTKPEDINFASGWNREKWLDFLDVWKKHHLNDMHAGTPKQEEALNKWRAKHKIAGWAYDKEVKYLKSIRLYNDKGHKYGTGWLRREVPKEAKDFLKSLPDADKQPAWV